VEEAKDMRIHIPGLWHTIPNDDYSHCAFTGKVLRFSKMMRLLGYEVIEYANEGSISEANEHVVMMTTDEFREMYPPLGPTEQHARDAVMGSPGHQLFEKRLIAEMKSRVRKLDIVAHPFGRAHGQLCVEFPDAIHVETGIGYYDGPFGAFRVFESEAWRHYHWGRWEWERDDRGTRVPHNGPGMSKHYTWVIPNYYDPKEWPLGHGAGGYVLYMGRIEECKGTAVIREIIEAWDRLNPMSHLQFMFAGQGDFPAFYGTINEKARRRVEYLGTVKGKARAKLVGDARCMIMPSMYVEPFGGAGVEGMLTGTPLIAHDYGAFTETIIHGITGYRCKTLGDWLEAIRVAPQLQRRIISLEAADRYSLAACARKYDRAFRQLVELWHRAWHSLEPVNIH
jgi:glycosyltransferase involved in cell wall biosynthesis